MGDYNTGYNRFEKKCFEPCEEKKCHEEKKCEEKKCCEPCHDKIGDFIKCNFQGAFITILLESGDVIFAEVVDGSCQIVKLKFFGFTFYVNTKFIELFF